MIRFLLALALLMGALKAQNLGAEEFTELSKEYHQKIVPILEQHCLDCHDEASSKGELDLERFSDLAAVRKDPKTWQSVLHQLKIGEMPPKKKNRVQPTKEEHSAMMTWTQSYLNTEARSQAGDPGPVVLRRLSNAEYTYTVRDITGVDSLDPLREFPVDSAAGEGFTNSGGALVMSPALLEKYLGAAKAITEHAVLLPNGFRFSEHTTQHDQSREILEKIRAFYLDQTGGGEIDFAYRSEVRGAEPGDRGEGRVDLTPYLSTLITNSPTTSNLNTNYHQTLTTALKAKPTGSFLLDHFRNRLLAAKPEDAASLAAEIRAWQNNLWTFQKIGTFGIVRPWQVPVSPVTTKKDVRLKIDPNANSLFLSAQSFGEKKTKIQWKQPRFERPDRPPILLRDVERGFTALRKIRSSTLSSTARYLAAVSQMRKIGVGADTNAIATNHQIDPLILTAWASYLGLEHSGRVKIKDLLTEPIANSTHKFVKGWTLPGVADFALLSNSSDQNVKIPGELNAHKVVVHPRPERWIAAGWMSPIQGEIEIHPAVRDTHNSCGNGVIWSLELRSGSQRRILNSGNVDLGTIANIKPTQNFTIQKGDLISLVIGARDDSHVCDLTEIDLTIKQLEGSKHSWSLSGDCADSIDAGNPHSDRHGNPAVWYFHGGMNDNTKPAARVPPGSLLNTWLTTKDENQAKKIAHEIESFLAKEAPSNSSEADLKMYRALNSLDGPLFSGLDFTALANQEYLSENFDEAGNLLAESPTTFQFNIPSSILKDAEFVVQGIVHKSSDAEAMAQMEITTTKPSHSETLKPGETIIVRSGGSAGAKLTKSFAEFRDLFPAAMCYARVVPADEAVTLQLYHRDDEHLARLMLSEEEMAHLDRLWQELKFVSQEPLRLVTAYEQIWQFSTQDSDPTKIEPLEAPVRAGAASFKKALAKAEPTHLDALITFAPKVYRRPLSTTEQSSLRQLYHQLRKEDLSHQEAFRLTLARLFTSAAFLYKTEAPASTPKQGPINSRELATRLSYFLTSSSPDAELTQAASDNSLLDPKILIANSQRLLHNERSRRLAVHFGCQWLHVRDFDQHDEKNENLYPEFAKLRGSMYEETVRFFTDFFSNDRSILSLLEADHTFVNADLAKFYKLPVPATDWQRVEGIRQSGRGGILGLATTLAKNSGASRTSLILRGTWVSETILGEKLPRPPKDVPPLPDSVPSGLSEREFVVRHSSDPACAKCHDRIDPYGFALEGYDTIGRFRPDTDTNAKLPDGSAIEGIDGLRTWLLTRKRDTFVRHFCRKLLGYALGREVKLSDEPLLDDIMVKLEQNNYRVGIAIQSIVLSRQFCEIRANRGP